eukprot:16527-Prorocentrum_minimum.AAC.2
MGWSRVSIGMTERSDTAHGFCLRAFSATASWMLTVTAGVSAGGTCGGGWIQARRGWIQARRGWVQDAEGVVCSSEDTDRA